MSQNTSVAIASVWVTPPAASLGSQRDLVAGKLNDILARFLETDCTHVWLVNADCQLPPDALELLIRLDVDIASGVSPTHTDWNETTVGWELPGGGLKFYRRMDIAGKVVGENEVVTTGNFCVLIKRRALLQYSSHHTPLRYQIMRDRKYIYGPELQLFVDAQEMGFSVRVHGGVFVGHWPEWPLSYPGHPDTLFKKIRGQN
uniref:Glycosyltransferase n=1 Tax=viral metagenome TaxID=1070528 RepID=A0A6M3M670_9ZZZZ